MSGRVLVVEDDAPVREALGQTLELAGLSTVLASAFIVAKNYILPEFDGVILSDIRMSGRDGFHLLAYANSVDPELPVILLTGEGDIPMAVGAIQSGAFEFLERPCANETMVAAIGKAMKARALVIENRQLKRQITAGDAAARMIFGTSDVIEALRTQIRTIAPIEDAVLIEGAPGCGIAKVAEVIHLLSARAEEPFMRVAAVSLAPEMLEENLVATQAGSLFIDEFPALLPETQFRLLRAMENGIGGRVLAGTTAVPELGHRSGQVLPDLYYRLDALRLRVPALKERPEDIPAIFRQFVRQASEQANVPERPVTPEVVAELMGQDWPGNAQGLRNAAMRFVLGLDMASGDGTLGLAEKLAQVERTPIVEALQHQRGNASAAAEQLKLPRKTFYDKLAKHRIRPEGYR